MCPGFAYGFQARTPKVDSARKFNRREDSRRHRKMPPAEEAHHGKLLIKLMKNGPAILEGYYTLESAEGSQHLQIKESHCADAGALPRSHFVTEHTEKLILKINLKPTDRIHHHVGKRS